MTSRCHDNHFSGSRQNLAAIRTPLLIAVSYCSRGGSRIFFRRVCTRLLLYFNTNKPHSFLGGQNSSCIRKPPAISGRGGGVVRTPCTLPLDPPLCSLNILDIEDFLFQRMKTIMVYGLHCCARCKRLKLYVRFYGEIYV